MVKLKKYKRRKLKNKNHKLNLTLDYLIQNEIKSNAIRQEFSNECLELADHTSKKQISDHIDLTDIPFVTIDGKDSKDFDDAVWSQKKNDGIEIMIAISDVSFYVKPGDLLDLEAKKRGNSFYFPNKVVPMLPHELSSDICSLKPNKQRACVIVHSQIDCSGKILSFNFKRAKIKSISSLNYDEVEDFLKRKKISKNLEGKTSLIDNLKFAFNILDKQSKKRGKLDLDVEEYKIKVEKNNEFQFLKNKNNLSNKIIEELMIHANNIVANFLIKKNVQGIYRNHEEPSDEKIDKLKELFNQIQVSFERKQIKSQKYLSKILQNNQEPKSRKIKETILRIQSKAYYHYKNKGHFGLALENYTHFTSPIRRYSDLIAHRLIVDLISNNSKKNTFFSNDSFYIHLTNQEKKSDILERNIIEKSCCLYLQKIKRKDFIGFIDGFIEYGIFIKSLDLPFSGLLKFNTLKDDFYLYNESQLCAEGRKTGNQFKLNDKVKFSIRSIDPLKGKISLEKMKIINE